MSMQEETLSALDRAELGECFANIRAAAARQTAAQLRAADAQRELASADVECKRAGAAFSAKVDALRKAYGLSECDAWNIQTGEIRRGEPAPQAVQGS